MGAADSVLLSVLYDKDHYTLALATLKTSISLITAVSKDYQKLLKFARGTQGTKLRQSTMIPISEVVRDAKASLSYLEEVRLYLLRLPKIDPNTRSLLLAGFPNVGKSSAMNHFAQEGAEVEVQPYAFTTKSLLVASTSYKYLRWQIIDTPGLLDKPLDERNVVELQAITALRLVNAIVVYIIDLSVTCGYSVAAQIKLFLHLRQRFPGQPLCIALSKVDVAPKDPLSDCLQENLQSLAKECATELIPISTSFP